MITISKAEPGVVCGAWSALERIGDGSVTQSRIPSKNDAPTGIVVGLVSATLTAAVMAFFILGTPGASPALADVQVEELMEAGPLKEQAMGSDQAPVTVVEYASFSCSHCADFHTEVFPELKEKYIETGKVRYVLREFPLNNQAFAAAALARCVGDDKYFPFVDALYTTQKNWFCPDCDTEAGLKKLWKQAGLSEDQFKKCLDPKTNKAQLDAILEIRKRGAEKFGVDSTPTFFVNGKKVAGVTSLEDLEKAIEPHLKGS
jgi:protein-disulfide isomerase